jgi:DNA-binding NtrC family response regulator
MPRTLLVVEDEEPARYALKRVFSSAYRFAEAASVPEAREQYRKEKPDVVLLDYNLPGESGLVFLREVMEQPNAPAVIMVTAVGSERLAVEAMKSGAYDYLAKPYDLDELRIVVARAIERQELREEVEGLRDKLAGEGHFGPMIGDSRQMRELFQTAQRVAGSELPVLILGESGTGKDLLAQEIHRRSNRAKQPFVALNCAALPESLVESELFGYEKGAFTNALVPRAGKFEQAHRGTLFLDEIADMEMSTQAKILRAVESGYVERLGGTKPVPVDVRLISATNKEPQQMVRDGRFRDDLYFRLAAVTLYIPPLRSRQEDILTLVDHFWRALREKYQRTGPELMPSALEKLQAAAWPGNVRQLRSTVEKLFILSAGDKVGADEVAAALSPEPPREESGLEPIFSEPDFREARRRFEIEYLTRKLRENGGNVTRTAEVIGFARQSLQEKIKELGILK